MCWRIAWATWQDPVLHMEGWKTGQAQDLRGVKGSRKDRENSSLHLVLFWGQPGHFEWGIWKRELSCYYQEVSEGGKPCEEEACWPQPFGGWKFKQHGHSPSKGLMTNSPSSCLRKWSIVLPDRELERVCRARLDPFKEPSPSPHLES